MKEFIERGELFDYILYDLTEIPVSTSDTGERIPLRQAKSHVIPLGEQEQLKYIIMDLAVKLLSPQGVCIAQVSIQPTKWV